MSKNNLIERDDVRELVKEKYGAAALRVLEGQSGGCCGSGTDSGEICCGET